MIYNYLITAFRNIIRHKGFSFINIIGLSLSLSVCMLIILVIQDQYSYDRHHRNKNRIYRVESIDKLSKINLNYASTAMPLGKELLNNYSFVEKAAILNNSFSGEGVYKEARIPIKALYANSDIFNVFDYSLKWGNLDKILDEPYSIVLQEEESRKFFGDENPLGKMLQIDSMGLFKVTGVISNSKKKSHIQFEALISLGTLDSYEISKKKNLSSNNWQDFGSNYIYVLLKPNANQEEIQKVLDKISKEKYLQKEKYDASFYLQPLTEIVPGPLRSNEIGAFLFKPFVLFLMGIAFIVIMLAAFNYTSLSIARSLLRAKEVGIRKTVGATRAQVIIQFLLEAVLISLFAFIIGIALLQYILPGFTGMKMMSVFEVKPEQNLTVYLLFLFFTVLTGFVSGILPAVFISAFNPQKVLKGITNIRLFSRITLRKILLVTQFTFSMIFIITIILVLRQMNFMMNSKLGFDRDVIYNIHLNGQNFDRVKNEYSQIPEVSGISGVSHIPGTGNIWGVKYRAKKEDEKIDGDYFSVDANYISTMGIKLVAGKNFSTNMNVKNESFVILNEKAVERMKLGSSAEAIGKTIILDDSTNVEVIGVVENYKYAALFLNLRPMSLRVKPEQFNWMALRLNSKNMVATVNKLKEEWKKIDKYHALEGAFLDSQIREFYHFFEDILYIVGFTSLLIIVIASLGLLGMATYSTQTRIKEIAVRKVQGAQAGHIIRLISGNYLWLLLIAALIAMPLAYFANNIWFQFMAFHVYFGIGTLLFGALIVIIIGLITIASQTVKAARTNAADILKYE
jgi:putative ABC transport system permease protein